MVNVVINLGRTVEDYPAVRPLVETAADWLREILQHSPDPVDAEWTAFYNPKERQPLVNLRLTTPNTPFQLNCNFDLGELADRRSAELRFRLLYTGLLRYNTKKYIDRLAETAEHPEPATHGYAH